MGMDDKQVSPLMPVPIGQWWLPSAYVKVDSEAGSDSVRKSDILDLP